MQKHKSGERVGRGFYWNVKRWEAQPVSSAGGVLTGQPGDTHIRVPLLVVLVLAPLMGAAYAIFLPFIGFAMVAMYLGGLLKRNVTGTPPATEARQQAKKAA